MHTVSFTIIFFLDSDWSEYWQIVDSKANIPDYELEPKTDWKQKIVRYMLSSIDNNSFQKNL
jgi:hypothetical protein